MATRISWKWAVAILALGGLFCGFSAVVAALLVKRLAPDIANNRFSYPSAPVAYHSERGNYDVTFPGAARESQEPVPLPDGKPPVTLYMAQWSDLTTAYTVGHMYFDDNQIGTGASVEAFFESSRDAMVNNVHGQLLRQASIDVHGHPGLDLFINAPETHGQMLRGRLVVAGRRAYVITAIGPADREEAFLSSFVPGAPTDPYEFPHREALPTPPTPPTQSLP